MEQALSALDDLKVNLSVVLGRNRMPIHMLLRMGRGAVIELESTEDDLVEILANDHPVARGQIVVTGTRIAIEVTEIIRRSEIVTTPGATIGEGAIAARAAALA
jgi:flagellar motor switch protein FliN